MNTCAKVRLRCVVSLMGLRSPRYTVFCSGIQLRPGVTPQVATAAEPHGAPCSAGRMPLPPPPQLCHRTAPARGSAAREKFFLADVNEASLFTSVKPEKWHTRTMWKSYFFFPEHIDKPRWIKFHTEPSKVPFSMKAIKFNSPALVVSKKKIQRLGLCYSNWGLLQNVSM